MRLTLTHLRATYKWNPNICHEIHRRKITVELFCHGSSYSVMWQNDYGSCLYLFLAVYLWHTAVDKCDVTAAMIFFIITACGCDIGRHTKVTCSSHLLSQPTNFHTKALTSVSSSSSLLLLKGILMMQDAVRVSAVPCITFFVRCCTVLHHTNEEAKPTGPWTNSASVTLVRLRA